MFHGIGQPLACFIGGAGLATPGCIAALGDLKVAGLGFGDVAVELLQPLAGGVHIAGKGLGAGLFQGGGFGLFEGCFGLGMAGLHPGHVLL